MLSPVDEIKARLNLEDIIKEYVELKPGGANMKAPCPFHQEKTPSFMVSPSKQIWHCFGCALGGDMFTFIQQIEGVEFPEALRVLAKKANVTLERQDPVAHNQRTRMQDCIKEAARFFHAQMLQSSKAKHVREYLKEKRKLTDEAIQEWKLGWAPESWDATSEYLKKKGFAEREIIDAGMVVEKSGSKSRYYDRFRNRLTFPIVDHNGNFAGFTARTLEKGDEGGAKYINTPQTLIYDKSRVLYGLDKAKRAIREEGYVIVVEGNMDAIASHQAGVKNVVASSGTAFTRDQIMLLKRHTDTIVLAFDVDVAGQSAAERGIDLAWQEGMNVKIATLLGDKGKDPDDLIRQSVALWKDTLEKTQNIMDYFFSQVLENLDLNEVDSKRQAAKKLLPLINRLYDPIARDHYIQKLGAALHTNEGALREALVKIKKSVKKYEKKDDATKRSISKPAPPSKRDILSQRLIALLISDTQLLESSISELKREWITREWQGLYILLINYYNTVSTFIWGEFLEYVDKESPEQKELWNTIALLSEELTSQFGTGSDLLNDWRQVVDQLKKESVKEQQNVLRMDIEHLEEKLRHAEDLSEKDSITKQLHDKINQVSKLTGEINLGG